MVYTTNLDDVETELDHVFVAGAVVPGTSVHLEGIAAYRLS